MDASNFETWLKDGKWTVPLKHQSQSAKATYTKRLSEAAKSAMLCQITSTESIEDKNNKRMRWRQHLKLKDVRPKTEAKDVGTKLRKNPLALRYFVFLKIYFPFYRVSDGLATV